MRIRHAVVEYDLEEAAAMLNISPADLKRGSQCWIPPVLLPNR